MDRHIHGRQPRGQPPPERLQVGESQGGDGRLLRVPLRQERLDNRPSVNRHDRAHPGRLGHRSTYGRGVGVPVGDNGKDFGR